MKTNLRTLDNEPKFRSLSSFGDINNMYTNAPNKTKVHDHNLGDKRLVIYISEL